MYIYVLIFVAVEGVHGVRITCLSLFVSRSGDCFVILLKSINIYIR